MLNEEESKFFTEYDQDLEITKDRFDLGEINLQNKTWRNDFSPYFKMTPKSWEPEHLEWFGPGCWTILKLP